MKLNASILIFGFQIPFGLFLAVVAKFRDSDDNVREQRMLSLSFRNSYIGINMLIFALHNTSICKEAGKISASFGFSTG
jgi:hypothetical protein